MSARLVLLAILAFALLGGVALAPVEAVSLEWRDGGSLAAPRSYARAVTLTSGQILVVDGLDGADDTVSNEAELLDPPSGAVTRVPGRPLGRINGSATLLHDGRVLVAGGSERLGPSWRDVATTELFDPHARAWVETHPLWTARANHGATLLTDGRVLVAGGHLGTVILDSVEIFDPGRGVWKEAAKLPKPRALFSIATLPDGRVLVAGGFEAGLPTKTSVVYDPARNAWTPGPELAVERALHATVTLPSGDILVIGGQRAAAGSAERYDVKRGMFVHAGALFRSRMLPMAAVLRDGRVVVAGGLPRPAQILDRFMPTSSTEVWDAERNTWTLGPDLVEPVAFGAVATTKRGVWIIGGAGEDERPTARIQRLGS